MKRFLAFPLLLAPLALAASESKTPDWNDTIRSDQGQFAVSVLPSEKKIEVKKVDGSQGGPPHLRVRVLRRNDRPLELALKTVERTDEPLFYTGQFKQWNESYIGLEVDFSFDKKTWKRLGKTLRKLVP
jgi:hypothetical protein